jgi:DNA repair protein RadA/Sms
VTVLTGTPGAGKTTLAMLMADALTAKGHLAVFNSGEESPFQMGMTAERLGLKHGFCLLQEATADGMIEQSKKLMKKNPGKQLFLFVDSLQTIDDGHFKSGRITCATVERALEKLTDFAKKEFVNLIVIGQVTKDGKMAGTNKLKHLLDVHMHVSMVTDDEDPYFGCRMLETSKNRFGTSGLAAYLKMTAHGFKDEGCREIGV